MEDIVPYVREEQELRLKPEQFEEVIGKLREELLGGRRSKLETAELLAMLASDCVETELAAWEILNHSSSASDSELLETIEELEEVGDRKSARILSVVELIDRLRSEE